MKGGVLGSTPTSSSAPHSVRVVLIQFTSQNLWSSDGFWLRWRCREDQSPKV